MAGRQEVLVAVSSHPAVCRLLQVRQRRDSGWGCSGLGVRRAQGHGLATSGHAGKYEASPI
eukprot:306334-Alexandrium_andersonii.AAC.1